MARSDTVVDLSRLTRIDHDHPWFGFLDVLEENGEVLQTVVAAYLDKGEAVAQMSYVALETGANHYYYPRFSNVTFRPLPGCESTWERFRDRLADLQEQAEVLDRMARHVAGTAPDEKGEDNGGSGDRRAGGAGKEDRGHAEDGG